VTFLAIIGGAAIALVVVAVVIWLIARHLGKELDPKSDPWP
jgi:hypothetical protein